MIKKGDNVIVIAGADKGKKGKVIKVLAERVVVEGVRIHKKHQKSRTSGGKGQILEVPSSIHRSNVMVVDPKSGKGTRLGKKVVAGKSVRISKKSGQEI